MSHAPFSATFVSMFGEDCMLGEGYEGVGEMALQQQRSQHAKDTLCCLGWDNCQGIRRKCHFYVDWWQIQIVLCGGQLSVRCPDQTLLGSENL